jgi:glycosyltransferase involved in cell wall biosynthesis
MLQPVKGRTGLALVLYVSPKPRSLRLFRGLDPIAGVPLIVRTLTRLRGSVPEAAHAVVLAHEEDSPLRRPVEDAGWVFAHARAAGLVSALDRWRAAPGAPDTFIVWPEGALFADGATARRLCAAHDDAGADATLWPASPLGLTPIIVRADAVPRLTRAFEPGGALAKQVDSFVTLHRTLATLAMGGAGRADRPLHVAAVDGPIDPGMPNARAALVNDCHTRHAAERVTLEARSDTCDHTDALAFWEQLDRAPDLPPPIVRRRPAPPGARRVLFYSARLTFAGAEQCLLALMAGLDRTRYDPVLAVDGRCLLAERAAELGITVENADTPSDSPTPYNLRYWAALLERHDIGVVHLDMAPNEALMTTAFQRDLPILGHIRTVIQRPLPPIASCARTLIAISERIAASLRAAGWPAHRIDCIYDGIDLTRFDPSRPGRRFARAHLDLDPSLFVLTVVGRITTAKRQDVALRALRLLLDAGMHDVRLLLAGDTDSDTVDFSVQLDRLIAELDLGAHVRRLGFLTDPRVGYAATDALVVCMGEEGLGQCTVEGMAMGVPAIVPTSGGPREAVRDGREGFHYAPFDHADLARQVQRMREPGVLPVLAQNARERARAFDLPSHVAAVTDIYDGLTRPSPLMAAALDPH